MSIDMHQHRVTTSTCTPSIHVYVDRCEYASRVDVTETIDVVDDVGRCRCRCRRVVKSTTSNLISSKATDAVPYVTASKKSSSQQRPSSMLATASLFSARHSAGAHLKYMLCLKLTRSLRPSMALLKVHLLNHFHASE